MHPTRWAVLAATVLLGTAAPAAATLARLTALGGNADYVADEREALRWYASAVDHRDVAVFDLGRFDTGGGGKPWSDRIAAQSGGVHAVLGRDGRFGTAAAYFHTDAVAAAPAQVHAGYPGGAFSLVWARRIGGWDVGAGFRGTTYADYGEDWASFTFGREDYRHDWGLGLRRSLTETLSLEVAGEARNVMFALRDHDREISFEDSGNRSYALRTRLRWTAADGVTVTPLLDYVRDIQVIYSPTLADVAREDAWQLRAGVGCTMRRPDGDLFVFSAEYRDAAENQDGLGSLYRAYDRSRRTWWTLDVRIAAETILTPWLTGRFSLQYRRVDDTRDMVLDGTWEPEGVGRDIRLGVDTPLGLGLTARVGRVRLDAAYNDRSPLSLAEVPDADSPRQAANYATLSLRYAY